MYEKWSGHYLTDLTGSYALVGGSREISTERGSKPCRKGRREFISQLFVVPKSDNGVQPVINLKVLNRFIKDKHFKMEGFQMIKDVVKQ